MRFHLKKVITWSFTLVCFVVVFVNYYNRNLWIVTDTGSSHPWGKNFNPPNEHQNIHKPRYKYSNSSIENQDKLIFRPQTTAAPTPGSSGLVVWPDHDAYDNDRILNQLKCKPPLALKVEQSDIKPVPLKKILLFNGIGGWAIKRGQQTFIEQECVVSTCEITDSKALSESADAILFHHSPQRPWTTRPINQTWILFMLESPYHTPGLSAFSHVMNWTATYRHDSEIVAPYERYTLWDENVKTLPQNKSYAAGKTKKVAWFVSNCGARNTRKEYATELSKHISVDIYGSCGPFKCPRRDSKKCFELLNKDYKFYLAFENSNCRDYITEKFFVNGLISPFGTFAKGMTKTDIEACRSKMRHDVIPIVMGAAPEDYARAAPPHSFIHVDDFESPKELADYLHKLDQNDDLYNEYFKWKGTGRLLNTFFWCRVCAMLHDQSRPNQSYRDLEKWWRGPEVCIGKDNWRQHPRKSKFIVNDYL